MKRPKKVVDIYGVKVSNLATGEDYVKKFEVKTYFDETVCCYVLEFSPICFYTYKSKSSLLNAKKRRIIKWLEDLNLPESSVLIHSTFIELLETRYIW